MIDVDVYEIDNVDYYLLNESEIKGNSYLYLSNVDNENDFIIRKRDKEDPMILLPLDNEQEVKYVSLVFAEQILDK